MKKKTPPKNPLVDMKISIKDKQNNQWYCKLTKEEFKELNQLSPVLVFDGKVTKKFIRSYLTFFKNI